MFVIRERLYAHPVEFMDNLHANIKTNIKILTLITQDMKMTDLKKELYVWYTNKKRIIPASLHVLSNFSSNSLMIPC
jgi:hypothetical protein